MVHCPYRSDVKIYVGRGNSNYLDRQTLEVVGTHILIEAMKKQHQSEPGQPVCVCYANAQFYKQAVGQDIHISNEAGEL